MAFPIAPSVSSVYSSAAIPPYFSTADGSSVSLVGLGGDPSRLFAPALLPNNGAPFFEFDEPVSSIVSIHFEGLSIAYDIYAGTIEPNNIIATVGPDSGVTRYRRFRLNGATDGSTVVHVLCKRAFQPVREDNDIVHVGNIGAIKQGLLGRLMEDNGDIERAQYHWSQCMLLMEEEANSSRGAAVPRLNIDPYGTGMQSRMYQLY
jgi:hypothetical protein